MGRSRLGRLLLGGNEQADTSRVSAFLFVPYDIEIPNILKNIIITTP